MGILEFFGERHNPGPVGGLDLQRPDRGGRGGRAQAVVVAAVLFGGWLVLLHSLTSSSEGFLVGSGITLAYLIVAYWVHPTPDLSNIGWLGGLVDHPFRYSDDINRFLLFFFAVLWPACFVAAAFMDLLSMIRRRRLGD